MKIPTKAELERAIEVPFKKWAHRCHEVSLAIVKSGILGERVRVARGTCPGVGAQHSWIVLGWDCYDPEAKILDPTLWSYDKSVKGVWHGAASKRGHRPHGAGSIWNYGRPPNPKGPIIKLPGLSKAAKAFLDTAQPGGLDLTGWWFLAHAPVQGWPAKDIIEAMLKHPKLNCMVPIDIVGMVTDTNPQQLYLREAGKPCAV
jgi:hypothetical protein